METADEPPIDLDNFGQDGEPRGDDRQVGQDRQADEEDAPAAEPNTLQWTQAMDEILISNYSNFESLGTKSCFELLSALLPGTTAKQCYKRGKLLKLKKGSE